MCGNNQYENKITGGEEICQQIPMIQQMSYMSENKS